MEYEGGDWLVAATPLLATAEGNSLPWFYRGEALVVGSGPARQDRLDGVPVV
ncbi:MAG TPA: hypothetical protein VI703_04355 [Anaerolineales bacterium]|nr:hypothetical protein [Anaerolineales bacterium]